MREYKMARFEYDYYFGSEADQFRFLRIPKVFFEDPDYEKLGSDEKILYGFLHEQIDLSRKKDWIDEEGRIYVMRSLESIQKILHNCSQDKARTTMKNLIEFGLIEKKRQGQGKPDLIYVKNFITKKGEMSGSKTLSQTSRQGELNSASQNGPRGEDRVPTLSSCVRTVCYLSVFIPQVMPVICAGP